MSHPLKAGAAALVLALAAAPVAHAATDTTGCDPGKTPALEILDSYYLRLGMAGTTVHRSLWAEDNGVPGLQMRETGCSDGRVIPADQCVSYFGASDETIHCTTQYAASEAPDL